MQNFYKDTRGLSIIELMLAVLLLLIVLSLGMTLFFFGDSSFSRGTDQAYAQQGVRLVDEYFKRELRNSGSIILSNSVLSSYFQLDANGILINNGSNVSSEVINDIRVRYIEEIDSVSSSFIFEYEVTGHANGRDYVYVNQLLLNNINDIDQISGLSSDFISLTSNILNYTAPNTNIPLMFIEPGIATKGSYTSGDQLRLFLTVVNDQFIELNDVDAKYGLTLSDDLDSMIIESYTKINEFTVQIDLTGNLDFYDGSGTVTVSTNNLSGNGDLTASIDVAMPEVAWIEIVEVSDGLEIPSVGDVYSSLLPKNHLTEGNDFNLYIFDQSGRLMDSELAVWALGGSGSYPGVSILEEIIETAEGQEALYTLKINDNAVAGPILIYAYSQTNVDIISDVEEIYLIGGTPIVIWPDADGYVFKDKGPDDFEYKTKWKIGYSEHNGSQNITDQSMNLRASNSGGAAERTFVTTETIDLTEYSKIIIEWINEGDNSDYNASYLIVSGNQQGSTVQNVEAVINNIGQFIRHGNTYYRKTDEIDISSLSGDYYLRIHARDTRTNNANESNLVVFSLQLIK